MSSIVMRVRSDDGGGAVMEGGGRGSGGVSSRETGARKGQRKRS